VRALIFPTGSAYGVPSLQEFHVLTGSADQTVALWDLRKLGSKVHGFVGHQKEVFQVQWSPFNESVFASSGVDGRVLVWDVARIGGEQTADEAEAGPAELVVRFLEWGVFS
jgi:histone-binding protein RBBP4